MGQTGRFCNFTILGHRGAKGYEPENTIVSFLRGIELGANMLELDIHLSKDGNLIVMHDADVDRMTDGYGLISELTLDQIKKLKVRSLKGLSYSGQRVPISLIGLSDW